MTVRLLDEDTTLGLDGRTVRLRPSLRCALKIANAHGPEPIDFCAKAFKGHLGLFTDLLTFGALDPEEREHALSWLAHDPLPLRQRMELLRLPLYEFAVSLAGIDPAETTHASAKGGDPVAFNQALAELFGFATGVLHWAPEDAWNATAREIAHAMTIWRKSQPGYEPTDEERAKEMLNSTFDRAAFESLKIMGA